MNIGRAGREAGLPTKTIRYYEEVGLIPKAGRSVGGYRQYSVADVRTLQFVARARSLGFTVHEVSELLSLYRDRRRASAAVKAIALQRIADIDQRIAALGAMRRALATLAERCHGDDRPDCPILDDLAAPGSDSPR
ncbi:MAG: Cu(I)-responsive transcriptional regulator [Alphaproteobacteria bacterium]|nr:Cu(I)-responsive transcriptional regulator [Alphaproteobacteria bacterium]